MNWKQRSIVPLIAALILSGLPCSLAQAQTLLRWKLKAGDKLTATYTHDTTSTVTVNNKPVESRSRLVMDLLWVVDSADDQAAQITQSVRRVQAQLWPPGGAAPVSFDTDSQQPDPAAKDLAAAFSPLLGEGVNVRLTMTSRGEIKDVAPSESLTKLWAIDGKTNAEKGGAKLGGLSSEFLKGTFERALVVLPEQTVVKDQTWSVASDVKTPDGKTVKLKSDYTFLGSVEKDGQPLEKIAVESAVELPPGSSKLTIKEQKHSGVIWFSIAAGRVVEAEQTRQLVTERTYQETPIVTVAESKLKVSIEAAK